MKVEKIEKFVFNGQEYPSLKAVREAVENTIGAKVVEKMRDIHPFSGKQRLQMLELLTRKDIRQTLLQFLNVKIENEEGDFISIFTA